MGDCLAGRPHPVRLRLTDQAAQDPGYTIAALIATDALIARDPEGVAAAVRAIVKTQQALKGNPAQAAEVGRRPFPPDAAAMIANLVPRDLLFYDPVVSDEAVAAIHRYPGHRPPVGPGPLRSGGGRALPGAVGRLTAGGGRPVGNGIGGGADAAT